MARVSRSMNAASTLPKSICCCAENMFGALIEESAGAAGQLVCPNAAGAKSPAKMASAANTGMPQGRAHRIRTVYHEERPPAPFFVAFLVNLCYKLRWRFSRRERGSGGWYWRRNQPGNPPATLVAGHF